MKRIFRAALVCLLAVVAVTAVAMPASTYARTCAQSGGFFGLPHWYDGVAVTQNNQNFDDSKPAGNGNEAKVCAIVIDQPEKDIPRIIINILNILLYLVGLIAVLFIIVGGIRYIISGGDTGGVTAAKQTIIRAIVGLVIAISAVLILQFVIGIFNLKSDDNFKITKDADSFVVERRLS